MLPPPARWLEHDDGVYLQWNYRCIGWSRLKDGKVETLIRWRGKVYEGTAGSVAQGQRWVTRWVEARSR